MVVTGVNNIRTRLTPLNRTTHRKVLSWPKSVSLTPAQREVKKLPPSEVPEPDSRGQATASPTSPITIGSAEEDNGCSRNNDTEPSEEETQVETITSMSERDKIQEGGMDAIPTSPATIEAARAAEQREQMEGERAEETESGATDEVIDIDVGDEAIPAQTSSSPNETRATALAQTASHSLSRQRTPASLPPAGATAEMEKTGMKRPASIASLQDEDERSLRQCESCESSSKRWPQERRWSPVWPPFCFFSS